MLDIRNLTADLGDFTLRGIDLTVQDGEYFVILGPTGAGKTILLELIAGIYTADDGTIALHGDDVTNRPPKDRPVSMVYQDYMLFPHMTVEENVRFGLESEDHPEDEIRARVEEFVDLLDIEDVMHRYPRTLSGGEKQRATLARSLVLEPDLLLLDEPVSALDVPSEERILRELETIRAETDVTIMHVTHGREEAIRLGDRVAIMHDGEIAQAGDPRRVFEAPESEFVANFVGVENVLEGESIVEDGVATVELDPALEIEAASEENENGNDGKVKACIRPDAIRVSTEPVASNGHNAFDGEVTRISEREDTIRVTVDVGVEVVASMSKLDYAKAAPTPGDSVHVAFDRSAVHLI
jgi:ABC-type Fe3+/spermidine/putrescine transport system ATPase subunit